MLFQAHLPLSFLISSLILAASSNSRLDAASFIFLLRAFKCFFKLPPTFDPSEILHNLFHKLTLKYH